MKKLASIFAMLLMVLTLSFTTGCSSLTIGAAMSQLNSECPVDMGNGMTMTSAQIENGDAVVVIEAPSVPSSIIENSGMSERLKESVKSDAQMSQLLKDSNTKLIYRIKASDGTVDVSVSPSDL